MTNPEPDSRVPPSLVSRPEVRLLVFGIPLAVGAGILLATILSHPAEASTPQTSTKVFMAEVRPGDSLRPRAGGALITQPKKPQRFAVWSQAVYEGDVDQQTVEALISAQRAEALEGKLGKTSQEALRKSLFDTDQEIMEVGEQYHDEFQRVSALLRQGDGVVVIRTHPREKDPRWPEVIAMQQRMKNREGLISGTYQPSLAPTGWKGKPEEAPMAFVFAAWKDWPIWQRYKEKYDLLLYQRVMQSRRWISVEFEKNGMKMFRN